MKVKAAFIFNGLQTIMDLSEKPMPVRLSAKLLRLADDLTKENSMIEKQRRLIIEKYGDKDENGELIIENGNITFSKDDNGVKAQQELDELANLEIDLTDRNITEDELINADIQLSMSQLATLREFLHKEENIEIIE